MNGSEPLVSVIIPVYNAEEFIPGLIEQLSAQTFRAWEAVLVLDGPTDGSEALVMQAAAKDARLRVVKQRNGGVSRARNRGLQEMRGETFVFIDADDLFAPDYLEQLYGAFAHEAERPNWVASGYQALKPGDRFLPASGGEVRELHTRVPECCYKDLTWTVVWAKLFDAQWFRRTGVFFDETLLVSEDTFFMICLITHTRRMVYLSQYLGYGYRRPESGKSLSARHRGFYCEAQMMMLKKLLESDAVRWGGACTRRVYRLVLFVVCRNRFGYAHAYGVSKAFQSLRTFFPRMPFRLFVHADVRALPAAGCLFLMCFSRQTFGWLYALRKRAFQ